MQPFGYCPHCHELRLLTEHHVFPRRFFRNNDSKLRICRKCHDEIELIIPLHRKLSKSEYLTIHKMWLTGTIPVVIDYKQKGGGYENHNQNVATTSF